MDIEARLTSGVYGKRPLLFVRGEGRRVQDASGRWYLDFIAGIGTLCLGHCPPAVVKALQHQAATMISCTELFYNDARARLLDMLDRTTPACFNRFFLCNSGTEAMEGAIKLARQATGRKNFVAFERAFHGRSMGALSATAKKAIRDPFVPMLPGFSHVPFDDPAALEAAVTDDTAAIIFEPVQGEGGIYELSPAMAHAIQRQRERGVLLIADEIQSGVFRTGKPYAFQHLSLTPDFICIAKALGGGFPIGALAIGPRIPELPKGCHGSTYGGSPLGCAAAEAVLRTMVDDRLGERCDRMGRWFRQRLMGMNLPGVIEARGRGLMIGIQLDRDPTPVISAMQERGLLALTAGVNTIRMLPPFNTTEAEFEEALSILEAAMLACA